MKNARPVKTFEVGAPVPHQVGHAVGQRSDQCPIRRRQVELRGLQPLRAQDGALQRVEDAIGRIDRVSVPQGFRVQAAEKYAAVGAPTDDKQRRVRAVKADGCAVCSKRPGFFGIKGRRLRITFVPDPDETTCPRFDLARAAVLEYADAQAELVDELHAQALAVITQPVLELIHQLRAHFAVGKGRQYRHRQQGCDQEAAEESAPEAAPQMKSDRHSVSVIDGKTDKSAIAGTDNVIARRGSRERFLAPPILAHAVEVVIAVQRHQVLVLAQLTLIRAWCAADAQVLVCVSPGIECSAKARLGQRGRKLVRPDHMAINRHHDARHVTHRSRSLAAFDIGFIVWKCDRDERSDDRDHGKQLDKRESRYPIWPLHRPLP